MKEELLGASDSRYLREPIGGKRRRTAAVQKLAHISSGKNESGDWQCKNAPILQGVNLNSEAPWLDFWWNRSVACLGWRLAALVRAHVMEIIVRHWFKPCRLSGGLVARSTQSKFGIIPSEVVTRG